jgi:hypothetical protein
VQHLSNFAVAKTNKSLNVNASGAATTAPTPTKHAATLFPDMLQSARRAELLNPVVMLAPHGLRESVFTSGMHCHGSSRKIRSRGHISVHCDESGRPMGVNAIKQTEADRDAPERTLVESEAITARQRSRLNRSAGGLVEPGTLRQYREKRLRGAAHATRARRAIGRRRRSDGALSAAVSRNAHKPHRF